ncbi:hypothetical protein COCNU_06G003920 [Cocos nucifera]|uniref:Uncharacterized protein n=1 Tax=Cocos nucifera TaxID=13894 RepID=A0A8K0IA53_COCNU|nr:hypothetical protein COCNU_06G003920 [Cocos nucifera]
MPLPDLGAPPMDRCFSVGSQAFAAHMHHRCRIRHHRGTHSHQTSSFAPLHRKGKIRSISLALIDSPASFLYCRAPLPKSMPAAILRLFRRRRWPTPLRISAILHVSATELPAGTPLHA